MARATLLNRFVLGTIVMLVAVMVCDPTRAAGGAAAITLAPHRAIYDLTLGQSHGQRAIESVRGRILYDFSGSACDGYALNFRQVSELDNGEGKVSLSDLRAVTWEDASAKNFRFNSENFVNQEIVDAVDGRAERVADRLAVKLSKPKPQMFDLAADMVFPTEHIRRTIEAAREGQTILQFQVYDGSETGQKVYNTMTVIGREIPPGAKKPTDAAASKAALQGLKRWPVTISYFDKNANEAGGDVDVLLSGRRVGATGKAYGLDMTDEMLALARENQRKAGATNVEFLKGEIEAIPLPDNTVDVIISNCVINLSGDKDRVLREAFRVLKPGGRFAVSDVVTRGAVPEALRRDMLLWVGCIAGALEEDEYRAQLTAVGFAAIGIEPTRVYRVEDAREFLAGKGLDIDAVAESVDGKFMSAFIRATKPLTAERECCAPGCCA